MTLRKKITTILLIFVIAPIVIYWYSGDSLSSNSAFQKILIIPILGTAAMSYLSFKAKSNGMLVFSVVTLVLSVVIFYIVNSLSNFGF
jgi:hypothetical protein